MTPERWQQIEKLYHRAQSWEDSRREALLKEACEGDDELCREVESLLAAERLPISVLDHPVDSKLLPILPPHAFTAGRQVGGYTILSLLGSGGMGEVYLAKDTQLGRKVAIKFLRPQLISDPQARERLVREARSAAKLEHPNICAIYQVVDNEQHSFIVMQYVDGETLATHIARGPLSTERALDFATQAASALAEAHSKRIVHRDIKPQNIMITPTGRVQVLDFGLARIIAGTTEASGDVSIPSSLTEDGLVVGTVSYMSPEQLRGESVDARTDIFSLGIVIYEMLTGRQPFICASQAETIAGILNAEPPSPRRFAPRVPNYLVAIVAKALKKERAERYTSGAEIMKDLQVRTRRVFLWPRQLKYGIASTLLLLGGVLAVWRFVPLGGGDAGIRSIAVLPLENLSGNSSQEYFAAGITESLISTLAQIRSLKVISRTSVMRYKGTHKPGSEIGRELGVDAILEGSVQQSGGRVRISAQLIRTSTDAHLWAQEYERDAADLLQLEGEVAQSIASRIRIQLTADETRRLKGRRINPEAQQAYLRGRYYSYNMNDHDQLESIRNFEEAIRLQPDFGAAYAGIAFGWIGRFDHGFVPFHEAEPQAREAATKAIQLAPELPDGHVTLADLSEFNWDWKAGEPEYRRAIELDPNFPDGRNDYSYFLISQGRLAEAIAQIEAAAALDPLSPLIHTTFGLALARARRYPEARQHFAQALELEPQNPNALRQLTNVAEQGGDLEKALNLIEQQVRVRGGDIMQVPQAGRIYLKLGKRADALRVLANVTKPGSPAPAMQVASLYFALGDKDRGFEWLTKAFDGHEVVTLLKTDPLFDSVHSDPRFQALLSRLGVPD